MKKSIIPALILVLVALFLISSCAHHRWGKWNNHPYRGAEMCNDDDDYYRQSEKCRLFLNATTELRKLLYEKRMELSVMLAIPDSTPEAIGTLSKEIYTLEQQIEGQAPEKCPRSMY